MIFLLNNDAACRALLLFSVLLPMGMTAPSPTGVRWHVDQDQSPGGSGLDWQGAFDSLDFALQQARPGDEVWVRRGVYYPTVRRDLSDRRSAAFILPEGVALRGGFAGHEHEAAQRGQQFPRTVLSGDLGVRGSNRDNAYHVVISEGGAGSPMGASILGGFVIRDGCADKRGHARGAGLRVSGGFLRIQDCTFEGHYGVLAGAIFVSGAQVRMTSCLIRNNVSAGRGGGMNIQASRCHVVNTRFYSNLADRGGAIYVHSVEGLVLGGEPPVGFINLVVHDNHARAGGAVFLQGSLSSGAGQASFVHCTVVQNYAMERGGGILARSASPQPATSWVFNSILWANRSPIGPDLAGRHLVLFSNLSDGAWIQGTNMSKDPLFVNPSAMDFSLGPMSPCIDAGSSYLLGGDWADVDRDGNRGEDLPLDADNRRRQRDDSQVADTGIGPGVIADLGAYER